MGIICVRQVCKKCAVSSIVSDECYREMDNENELAEAARDWVGTQAGRPRRFDNP